MSKTENDAVLRAPSTPEQLAEFFTPVDVLLGLSALRTFRRWPRGHGETVLVLPGYGGADGSTWVIRQAMARAGYAPSPWGLGRNNGDVPTLLEQCKQKARALFAASGEPIHLVGWSLGGYIAREVARDLPAAVAGVVTLGSPVVGGPKYTTVAKYWNTDASKLDEIEQAVAKRYDVPLRCPVVSIYSRRDGVVQWRASVDQRTPGARNVEVASSHLALGFSGKVLGLLLQAMAENIATGRDR